MLSLLRTTIFLRKNSIPITPYPVMLNCSSTKAPVFKPFLFYSACP